MRFWYFKNIIGLDLGKILSIKMLLFSSKSHCDGSFEYPQHMFSLRNKKIIF